MYTSFRLKAGDHVFNEVVIGKNGWMFYTGETSISDYQKTVSINKAGLAFLQKELDDLGTDLEKNGITLLVVIPPNKSTVYPEFMPDEIPVIGEKSRLDQFVEFMNTHGHVTIVDLRQALLDVSQWQDIYFKTDAHWNDLGAYYGYVEIMKALSSSYPNLQPHPLSDYQYKKVNDAQRDILTVLGLSNNKDEDWVLIPKFKVELKETNPVLFFGADTTRVVMNNDTRLPRLLVFHDSFYRRLSYFIEPHFSRITTIPLTDKPGIWSLDWIHRENPDVVIIEVVERYLDVSLPMLLSK